jgi:hypothetical protein
MKYCVLSFDRFMFLMQVAFPPDLFSAYAMRFVPVQFRQANSAILQTDSRNALELTPATHDIERMALSGLPLGQPIVGVTARHTATSLLTMKRSEGRFTSLPASCPSPSALH